MVLYQLKLCGERSDRYLLRHIYAGSCCVEYQVETCCVVQYSIGGRMMLMRPLLFARLLYYEVADGVMPRPIAAMAWLTDATTTTFGYFMLVGGWRWNVTIATWRGIFMLFWWIVMSCHDFYLPWHSYSCWSPVRYDAEIFCVMLNSAASGMMPQPLPLLAGWWWNALNTTSRGILMLLWWLVMECLDPCLLRHFCVCWTQCQ